MSKTANKNILVIDDDDVMCEKLSRMLGKMTHHVTIANSGEEASTLLVTQEFDCVLLDNCLGDIDGIDFLSVIQPTLNKICPIIMITGAGDERVAVEAMRRGAYDYISKHSLHADNLESVINAGLKWASLEAQLKASQEKLEFLSMYDSLTSLPNRQLFFDRLEHALLISRRDKSCIALFMMDLNKFKQVNDSLGHAAGDELLVQVSERLKDISRESDTFARLGGDEFAGILYQMRSIEDACKVAEKINSSMNLPFKLSNTVVNIGISIGITLYHGEDIDAKALLAQADQSMYKAKKSAMGYATYDIADEIVPNPSLLIASCLSHGLANGEFYMMFQPQVDLVSGKCCGVEALARWNSSVLGNIPPDVFIKIAENSAIIVNLTYSIFEMCFKQVKLWENQHLLMPISINLSAKLLHEKTLVPTIRDLLDQYAIDPQLVTIEITETALMNSPQEAEASIQQLSDLGIQISIDDFGTGFTSFTHLRHFAVNELKIDKLFIKDLKQMGRDASIVGSFVSLANGFGVKLVAEGVEDGEKLDLLKAAGCSRAQGYWISRPLAGDQLQKWLFSWNQESADASLKLNQDELSQDKLSQNQRIRLIN